MWIFIYLIINQEDLQREKYIMYFEILQAISDDLTAIKSIF